MYRKKCSDRQQNSISYKKKFTQLILKYKIIFSIISHTSIHIYLRDYKYRKISTHFSIKSPGSASRCGSPSAVNLIS